MNQKEIILEYLENAYIGAKVMNDVETMTRLSRAIVAFSYDNFEEKDISWDKMFNAYMFGE